MQNTLQHIWSRDLYEVTADAAGLHLFVPTVDEVAAGMKTKHRERFEAALSKLDGTGMTLRPVVYTRIAPEDNKVVLNEFMETAEPGFYKRLARDYEDDLRAAGFCDHAIMQMKKGYSPTDSEGRGYNYDVDHVVERSGGGQLSTVRRFDPALTQDDHDNLQETFDVNHMSNFYFIPREVHEIKNEINDLQTNNIGLGESKVIYMVVPSADVDVPFFRPNEQYGPRPVSGQIVQQSYAALSEVSHAGSLIDRFHDTPEGSIFQLFCETMKDGEDSPERRAIARKNAESIIGSDEKMGFRYHQICDTLQDVASRVDTIVAEMPHAARADQKSAVKNYNALSEKLSRFSDFILEDGSTVGAWLEKSAESVRMTLSSAQDFDTDKRQQPATLTPKT